MGVAASIVSAVLKSVVGDKLGSGLAKDIADISIGGVSEKGIKEISDFIKGGKSKIDSVLSKENIESMGIAEDKSEYVITEIKNLLSKIDITDEVLRQCKYNSGNVSAFFGMSIVSIKIVIWNVKERLNGVYLLLQMY